MNAREELDSYLDNLGYDKNVLLGYSEVADFAEWYADRQVVLYVESSEKINAPISECPFCGFGDIETSGDDGYCEHCGYAWVKD